MELHVGLIEAADQRRGSRCCDMADLAVGGVGGCSTAREHVCVYGAQRESHVSAGPVNIRCLAPFWRFCIQVEDVSVRVFQGVHFQGVRACSVPSLSEEQPGTQPESEFGSHPLRIVP